MNANDRRALVGRCLFLSLAAVVAAVMSCSPGPTRPTANGSTPTPAVSVTPCNVGAPDAMTSFEANPATIDYGQAFTLTWTAPCGYVALRIKEQIHFIQNQASNGSYALRPGLAGYPVAAGDTAYEAVNGDAARQRLYVTVTVRPGNGVPQPTATPTSSGSPTPTPTGATPTPTVSPTAAVCGNTRCESGETQSNCCFDCGCPVGQTCQGTAPGTCTTTPGCPGGCNDGNACTADSCVGSTCQYTPISCNDGNACTNDSCNTSSGCVYTPTSCNDGNACTNDSCNTSSGCVYTPISCNDGNACTNDSCNTSSGCQYTPISCNDGNACTNDSCNTSSGCVYTPISPCCGNGTCEPGEYCGCVDDCNGLNCNDGASCSSGDQCRSDGVCRGSSCLTCSGLMGDCDSFTCGSYCGTCYCAGPGTSVPVDCGACP